METARRHEISQWIKNRSSELGFAICGIARAALLEKDAERLNQWLANGFHGEMHYMARNTDKRPDPRILLPEARSVIMLLVNYFPAETLPEKDNYKIARYAYGMDYHLVIREKLNQLGREMTEMTGPVQYRAFTDSAPVMERAWAEKAGLGWIGKNTCLINPNLGSFVFIGEIITDLELEYDDRITNDRCGGCTRCIDACPTGAIIAPHMVDSRKCISYYTIEFRGDLPSEEKEKFNDWIFGCDICQEVCPWNRKALPHCERVFLPAPGLIDMNKEKWEHLSSEEFNTLFKKGAVKRTGFEGLKRNINFLKK